jgi:Glycosyl hydrolases family 43
MRLISRVALAGSCLLSSFACGGGSADSGDNQGGSPTSRGGNASSGSANSGAGAAAKAGASGAVGGASASGGAAPGGASTSGGASPAGGGSTAVAGGSPSGGAGGNGGAPASAGASPGGAHGGGASGAGTGTGGASGASAGAGGAGASGAGAAGSAGASCSGPIGTLSGALATGINFLDTDGARVDAHGGGIIKVGDTFYLHGEYFSPTTTDNDFNGFSMYSSKDLATWKNEGMILPQQASGELGPKRKGERPHIVKCPSTGEFVLYAHAASEDYQTDKEVVYATSTTVNGKYAYKGPLKDAGGNIAAHSDMTAISDGNNAYVMTESGHVYTLAADCHSWLTDKTYAAVNGNSGGSESPTVFKAGSTYYWIGSNKTGWRANNNFYSTAPAITGPWTYQGFVAPVTDATNDLSDQRTWLTQSTWVQPVTGCNGTTYIYWGDHWDGNLDTTAPGKHNNLTTFVFQPLVFTGTKIGMPTYLTTWKIDVGAGTYSQ